MDEEKRIMENPAEEPSFAELLEESFVDRKRLKPGEKIEAEIVKITSEWIFIDLGSKSEGYLDRNELVDEEGNVSVKEGDVVQVYFLSAKNNEFLFTTRIGKGEAGMAHLEEAFQSGIPVEGFVEKEIKGGFEVKVAGNIRGFCPYSQMGLARVKDATEHVGHHVTFKVIEYSEKGRKIVLSNRAILEEEQEKQREALKQSLHQGMTVRGTVTSIQKFGAFIDLGGVQGLAPISEIGWGRIDDVGDVLTVGQEIELVIIGLDWEKDRITLSLKELLPDPWENVETRYPTGTTHAGTVSRLAKFGAFVTLEPGVDGLLHISRLTEGKRIKHPGEVVTEGESIEVKIDKVDRSSKRLSLTLAKSPKLEATEGDEKEYRRFMDSSVTSLGTLGDILKNKLSKEK